MKKNIIVLSAAILLATTSVHAISPYLVISTTDETQIKELKEKIYKLFNTRYTKNIAILNNPDNKGKVAYQVQIASNLDDIQTSTPLNSYAAFEKAFDKLYSNLNYNEKIIVRYTTTSRVNNNGEVVDYKENKYTGEEKDVIWTTLEDGTKVGKIAISKDTETNEPRFIKVNIGDVKLDTSKPIYRQKNGYYVDKNGYSIKKVDLNEIQSVDSLPNGVIDGYYEDSSIPLGEDDKVVQTDAIVKRADEINTKSYNVSDLYEVSSGRLTITGNELFKYINNINNKENYTVKYEAISNSTYEPSQIYIDNSSENKSIKYTSNDEVVNSNDLYSIKITIKEIDKNNRHIVNEINIKPDRKSGLDNILNIMLGNIPTPVLAGMDRYLTSAQVSKNGFSSSDNVVLVSGESDALVDGLTSTPLAASLNAPILLTKSDELPSCIIDEIDRLGAKNIYIVGGANSISNNISNKLERYYGKNVKRIDGNNRYETSIAIGEEVVKNTKIKGDVFVVGGYGMADALSISSVSASKLSPIILTKKDGLSIDAKHFLDRNASDTYIVGGKSQVSNYVSKDIVDIGLTTKRLSGDTRQDTNGAVISEFYTSGKELYDNEGVVFAKSEDSGLVDALGAGVYAGKVKAPIVLASNNLTYEQEDALKDIKVKDKLYQVGYGIDNSVIEFLR
ncbi:cell wall-binding repeat-containing protein [Romboutsia sp. 1001216sp1]|uniref:cell wall-binding repeat-containing protein n=1 Tax=Romboutsia sp. 1001216sp1 TaxID=2986997 RepID=UPI0023306457|nr:cell wall-binding repeat-containing protein [Romboutsia sp. 1001216sp1]MDB8789331.1 cell wall-binding repeat-containing protein [Romboutsia sp. 1001216sp1]